ncbi:MAG: hypothetical protein EAZ33_02690 [Oscillatoriales cyanobacterium]|nr:MAG: hypothetical protein EAZ33_02690 [Oscillatoriales cyanobacterium]
MKSHCQPRLEDWPFGGRRQGFFSIPSLFPRESKQSIRVRFCCNASAKKKIWLKLPRSLTTQYSICNLCFGNELQQTTTNFCAWGSLFRYI